MWFHSFEGWKSKIKVFLLRAVGERLCPASPLARAVRPPMASRRIAPVSAFISARHLPRSGLFPKFAFIWRCPSCRGKAPPRPDDSIYLDYLCKDPISK